MIQAKQCHTCKNKLPNDILEFNMEIDCPVEKLTQLQSLKQANPDDKPRGTLNHPNLSFKLWLNANKRRAELISLQNQDRIYM